MKIKKGFVLHTMGNEHLMVATGTAARQFNGMVRSNETAQFLLEKLQNDVTEEELVEALLQEYDVDPATAARDVHRVIETIRDEGFLDE